MAELEPITQYVLVGVGALLATIAFLWLYNRREKRRKHALELSRLMATWGLGWFAEGYDMYAVGDYSGLVHKVREIVSAVRSDKAMIDKLWEATTKVAQSVAINDPSRAAELRTILGAGASTKTE